MFQKSKSEQSHSEKYIHSPCLLIGGVHKRTCRARVSRIRWPGGTTRDVLPAAHLSRLPSREPSGTNKHLGAPCKSREVDRHGFFPFPWATQRSMCSDSALGAFFPSGGDGPKILMENQHVQRTTTYFLQGKPFRGTFPKKKTASCGSTTLGSQLDSCKFVSNLSKGDLPAPILNQGIRIFLENLQKPG